MFSPKCTFKVSTSLAMNSHSLHWYFSLWYVCCDFLCFLISFSFCKTFSYISQAAGNSSKFMFEWTLELWIFNPCLDIVLYSHLLHWIDESSGVDTKSFSFLIFCLQEIYKSLILLSWCFLWAWCFFSSSLACTSNALIWAFLTFKSFLRSLISFSLW